MHISIDVNDPVPVFAQLVGQIRDAVRRGGLKPGTTLPAIRQLAADLQINPNTVAKAYRELEHEGVVELRHGAGAFVAGAARGGKTPDRVRTAQPIVAGAVERLRERGLTDDEIRRLFEAELAGLRRMGASHD